MATTTPEGAIDLRLEYLPDPNKKTRRADALAKLS